MTAANFDKCLKAVLAYEGGYSNHPKDPGGPTNFGIIQRVYDPYRKALGKPTQSVKKITSQEVRAIYKKNYWDVVRGDDLPSGVDLCVFDGAVNSGPSQSVRWLQRALGTKSVDGNLGPATLGAALDADPANLVRSICKQRLSFLQNLRTWSTFGTGWGRRVADVQKVAVAMADGKKAVKPVQLPAEETAKAPASETKITDTPSGNTATKTTTGGIFTFLAWLCVQFDWVSNKLSDLSGLSPQLAKYALTAMVVIGFASIVIAGGMALYGMFVRRSHGEAAEAY